MKDKLIRYVNKRIIFSGIMFFFFFTLNSGIIEAYISENSADRGRIEINLDKTASGKSSGADDKYIHIQDIDKLREAYSEGSIAFSTELDTVVESSNKSFPVKAVLSDDEYFQTNKPDIVKGSIITKNSSVNGNNAAVISENLAVKLFMTDEVIGNRIVLINEEYMVVGVYKATNSLLSFLGSDGMERVIVPFCSYEYYTRLPVEFISINDPELEKEGFRENITGKKLGQLLGVSMEAYRISDFYDSVSLLKQPAGIFIFLIGLWCIYLLLGHLRLLLKKYYESLKHKLEDSYFISLVRGDALWFLRKSAILICFAAGMVLVLLLMRFKLVIPSEYVPQDNIFDFNFYLSLLAQAIHKFNSSFAYSPSPMERGFYITLFLSILFIACMILTLKGLVAGTKLSRLLAMDIRWVNRSILTSLFAGLALGIALCVAGNIPVVIYGKGLIIIIMFIFLPSF